MMATRSIPESSAAVALLTRGCTCLLASFCLIGPPERALAQTPLRNAHVVWARDHRVYIASQDSVVLEAGSILTFLDHGKKVATGEVTGVHDAELIVANLTSGSLEKVKHLDRIKILVASPVFRAPPILRIGYPAPGRKNLLFDCTNQSLDSSFLQGAFKAVSMERQTYRLVRDSTYSVAAKWPDTLLVRLFDEVADEEIALERGDLDAALFWPGEASPHIREAMRWQGRPSGRWAGGILVTSAWRPGVPTDSTRLRVSERQALALLNKELFRGDLAEWPSEATPPPSTVNTRFEVDSSFPGRESIELLLNRAVGSGGAPAATRVIRLSCEIPPQEEVRQDLTGTVFDVRCPLLSTPKLRPYLEAIGIDPLANLFQCSPATRKP